MTNNYALLKYDHQKEPNRTAVKNRYLEWRKEQNMPYRCDNPQCAFYHTSNPQWNGKDIKMILDHIDGNPKNNLPSNLRLVCPNCNSQLATHGGGNIGRIQNGTKDSYHIVERSGAHEAKVFLSGVEAKASVGSLGVVLTSGGNNGTTIILNPIPFAAPEA